MPPATDSTATPSTAPENPPGSWASFWATVSRFQKDKLTPGIGFRNAVGIALPLIAGVATGNISAGLIVSAGALNVSFSDNEDPYRHRAIRMLIASVVVGIAVAVGSLCGQQAVIAVVAIAAWAFVAGMLVAVGTTAADIGTVSLVTLVVFIAQAMPLEKALSSGLLAFGGGLLQTALSLALWPVRRYEPERKALGELYVELSRVAASPVEASHAPPASAQSTHAQQALVASGRARSIEIERFRFLLSQAERMRPTLLMLARIRVRIEREEQAGPAREILDACFAIASQMLRCIGDSLLAGKPAPEAPPSLQELHSLSERLREAGEGRTSSLSVLIADARAQVDAWAGQLRSALDLAASTTPAGIEAFDRREAGRPWNLRLAGTIATLRANLSLDSAAFRHAVRLAVCVALGDIIAQAFHWRRSYWLPMTIAIVLKPDFGSTFSRGVLRLLGTFAGLVLATALFHVLPLSPGVQVALVAVFSFLLRWVGPANYGIFVTAVTALIVFLMGIGGSAPAEVMLPRGWNTVVGGTIALLAYWLWPTWERTQVFEALAQMLDGYRNYFRAVRASYTQPEDSLAHEMDRARLAGRLARSNLEASIERLTGEPGTPADTISLLNGILASSHRLVHAMMALEAGLARSSPVPARDGFRTFANDVELTLYYLASALRGSPLRRSDLPDLREDHHALIRSGDALTERYALVNVETDRITNSLNTLSEQVLRWTASRGQTPAP